MKSFQILGKIFSAFILALGFGACTPDCITCTEGGDSYTSCEVDGWDTDYGATWKDYVSFLKNYYKVFGGKCK